MREEVPREFRQTAYEFIRAHLPFLDRNWLQDVLDKKLAELLHETVKAHTSATSNTALREAAKEGVRLIDHVRDYMPNNAKACRCKDLDNGEHAPQPICHMCALARAANALLKAIETS
jgi:methionyl-tRNA synthetase